MASATLTKQVKDLAPGTIVNLVEISDGIATIRHNGKSMLIPASFIQRETKPLNREYAQINHEVHVADHMKTVKANLKGYEATHLLDIRCRCGLKRAKLDIGTGWAAENQAINQMIQSCTVCTPN